MEQVIIDKLNEFIRSEHGNKVSIKSKWVETQLDSFGTTMVFADMDNEYECFPREWFKEVDFSMLTIKDIVTKVLNESTKL